jgi:hypothetical protein
MAQAKSSRRLVLGGACLATLLATMACGLIVGLKDRLPAVSDEAGTEAGEAAAGDATAGDASDGGTTPCDASTYNVQGCACGTVGETRPCYMGVPGPKSQCNTPGMQQCALNSRWIACVGASFPADADTCFDDKDNECNGIVDDACKCSDNVDLCKRPDGGLYNSNMYNWFTDPTPVKANQPYNICVVTKQSVASPSMRFDNMCYGGGVTKPCPSPGVGCSGWNTIRFEMSGTSQGNHAIEIIMNDGNPPCNGPPVTFSFTLNVVP